MIAATVHRIFALTVLLGSAGVTLCAEHRQSTNRKMDNVSSRDEKKARFLKGKKSKPKDKKESKKSGKKCESFPTVSDLDLSRYAGRWYLIYGTDSPNIQKRCSAANYVYNAPDPIFGGTPSVDVVNSAFCSPGENCPPPYGQFFSIPGKGLNNPAFPDETSKLIVTLNTAPMVDITFNYWVIDVVLDPDDETAPYQFAALADPYYPDGALTYVLSRETTIDASDEETVAMLLKKIEDVGISLENIVPIVQEEVCVYDAE
mmetsp:Transcript_12012/g.18124  ORF Transcript_12012/g.18124 Transcript_12012/m.18124 type:complete len:260 (-) Transcript_12012:1348-2127(-)|eukprot:CAMPEP_0116020250 /NCGR_PEP_ID=MMETSP0321-20121206/9690_1 /TAXON_ID=163516 /ORGANISM="Leptocylindrus danicus var. danicus, Strain B650" /LENGTH=259 /DNA_ID=CAMNT_0003490915 /DNA_START=101 /DNA_END=880 /DNA_ORIENTATION=-